MNVFMYVCMNVRMRCPQIAVSNTRDKSSHSRTPALTVVPSLGSCNCSTYKIRKHKTQ